MKNIRIFYLKNFIFGGKNFSVYLNRNVYVMLSKHSAVFNNSDNKDPCTYVHADQNFHEFLLYLPLYEKTYLLKCVQNQDSNPRSLTRVFRCPHEKNFESLAIRTALSEDSGQTAQMHRLV